jgi:hypothetical protein
VNCGLVKGQRDGKGEHMVCLQGWVVIEEMTSACMVKGWWDKGGQCVTWRTWLIESCVLERGQ